jgi:hypothetical protein
MDRDRVILELDGQEAGAAFAGEERLTPMSMYSDPVRR